MGIAYALLIAQILIIFITTTFAGNTNWLVRQTETGNECLTKYNPVYSKP